MILSNDKITNEALLNTLGEELSAAWARFYAIEVNSRPGELEYDQALAAANWRGRSPKSSHRVGDGLGATGHFERKDATSLPARGFHAPLEPRERSSLSGGPFLRPQMRLPQSATDPAGTCVAKRRIRL
jgi:hypothetical protein